MPSKSGVWPSRTALSLSSPSKASWVQKSKGDSAWHHELTRCAEKLHRGNLLIRDREGDIQTIMAGADEVKLILNHIVSARRRIAVIVLYKSLKNKNRNSSLNGSHLKQTGVREGGSYFFTIVEWCLSGVFTFWLL